MQLTIEQVYKAIAALDQIIAERRPMPQHGKFLVARMYAKLAPEFATANAQRNELMAQHGVELADGKLWVPPERMPEFTAEWEPIAAQEVKVDVEPIPLAFLTLGTADEPSNGGIEVNELLALGDLITE